MKEWKILLSVVTALFLLSSFFFDNLLFFKVGFIIIFIISLVALFSNENTANENDLCITPKEFLKITEKEQLENIGIVCLHIVNKNDYIIEFGHSAYNHFVENLKKILSKLLRQEDFIIPLDDGLILFVINGIDNIHFPDRVKSILHKLKGETVGKYKLVIQHLSNPTLSDINSVLYDEHGI
jgi:hypothetical protein